MRHYIFIMFVICMRSPRICLRGRGDMFRKSYKHAALQICRNWVKRRNNTARSSPYHLSNPRILHRNISHNNVTI